MTGALALAASGCTTDPTATLRAGPKRLLLSASTLTVNVKDSVAVTATVLDEQGNPLPDTATAASSAPTVVSVSSASGAPLPVSKFFVKGLLFGSAYVKATAGSVTDSMKVLAYPASVSVTGKPDSLNSGSTVVLTATPRDAVGGVVAGVAPITWASDVATTAAVTTPGTTTTVAGKSPGVANVTATLPGKANTQVPLRVVPAPFTGSLSASTGGFGTTITATKGASEPAFAASTGVTVGGNPAFVTGATANTVDFVLPPVPATGANQLWFKGLGPDGLATRTSFNMTSAGGLDDPQEAATADPTTAPVITNGVHFITLHGACNQGVATSSADDCDDFFTIANSSGSSASVTVTIDWPDNSDVDILWCNAACNAFTGNFNGATGNKPETSTVTVASGVTIRLWLNLFAAGADPYAFVRITVSGAP